MREAKVGNKSEIIIDHGQQCWPMELPVGAEKLMIMVKGPGGYDIGVGVIAATGKVYMRDACKSAWVEVDAQPVTPSPKKPRAYKPRPSKYDWVTRASAKLARRRKAGKVTYRRISTGSMFDDAVARYVARPARNGRLIWKSDSLAIDKVPRRISTEPLVTGSAHNRPADRL